MSTLASRVAGTFCIALQAAACANAPVVRTIAAEPLASPSPVRFTVRFDNQGRDRVDVYVVGERRSWRIGRLEPGQARWLSLPADIPASDLVRLQLAVLANAHVAVDPMRDPRVLTTLRQPVGALMSQQWGYAFGQLTSQRDPRSRP